MKKYMLVALLAVLALAPAARADDTPTGVASDVGAVQKDNADIAKSNMDLAKDRAAKAKDKATGNMGGQAVDSMSIGADKVSKSVKGAVKSNDQDNLNSDVNGAVSK